ncbi:MFS transporter [Carnobacteriaceae bacterium zg-ZUI240]|nr:MFS transporter [Carnobacteriaceae bacterium zg-ZUI240]
MNNKMTKLEKQWILYDVGNSAFSLLIATIIPIVFNNLAKGELSEDVYFAYWGYAVTAATVGVAILGPIIGAISDRPNTRAKFFGWSVAIGAIGCALLPFFNNWLPFLIVFVLTKSIYNVSLVLYDSMLTDVTTPEKMDMVSSHGYAWGYVGSTIPFVISLGLMLFYESIGLTLPVALIIAFVVNALWWGLSAVPLMKNYKQVHSTPNVQSTKAIFSQLFETLREIRRNKHIFYYLISFVFFIDGVYTIINMATAYGTALGLSQNSLILALLTTQLVAFPCALIFSKISKKYPTGLLIKECIAAYGCVALFAIQLDQEWEFWMLAIFVGMFQGAIQALSRSYFAKIIPPQKTGEYFGIFDICGKGASIIGTLTVSLISQMTGSQQLAVGALSIMFFIGYVVFGYCEKFAKHTA